MTAEDSRSTRDDEAAQSKCRDKSSGATREEDAQEFALDQINSGAFSPLASL
jgi:hypothetical protein